MAILIGETITRFFWGNKFVFERAAKGEWRCVYKEGEIIPSALIDDLPD